MRIGTAALIMTHNCKLHKCLPEVEWINKSWCFHTVGHYMLMSINAPQLNPGINLTDAMLTERGQMQKRASYVAPLRVSSGKKQTLRVLKS